MLPTTLARGRATARGYGELLTTMLNTQTGSIPGLNTYRYSPYTIPGPPNGSAAAAAAALAAAASPPSTLTVTSTPQPVSQPIVSSAPAAQPALPPAAHMQQLQLLGLMGQLPAAQTPPTSHALSSNAGGHAQHGQLAAALAGNNNGQLAAQILALNNQAVAAAAAAAQAAQAGNLTGAPCKQRAAAATLPNALIDGSHQPISNGLNYSMNDLINLQGLQFDAASAANFQVPVGL